MTTIRLNNDYDRGNFQIKMALMYLASEVKSGMIMCHPSKGTTVRTLARYFPGLKEELDLYNTIKGLEEREQYEPMQKAIDKFSRLNPKAYMVLVD